MPHHESDRPTVPAPAGTPVLRDEAALRRAFDEHHDTLLALAVHRLGDADFLAPRVLEQTFVVAWHERASMATEADLSIFLTQAVQHRAARALSRHEAAYRLGHHGENGPHAHRAMHDDRELEWAHILHDIHAEAHEREARREAGRLAHDAAAVHIKEVAKGSSWMRPVLSAAALVVVAFGGIWLMDRVAGPARLQAAVNSGPSRTVDAGPGQLGAVTLAEGSRVELAPESRIVIPEAFGADLRAVRIEGAARIAVAEGASAPLTVFVKGARVVATGTIVTLRGYADDDGAIVRLDEGTAAVAAGDSVRPLAAGEALYVAGDGTMRAPTSGELAEGVSWTTRTVTVHERRLADVLTLVHRWYRERLHATDASLLERRVSFAAPLDSLGAAIRAIEASAGVQLVRTGEQRIFVDAGAPGAAP